MDITPATFEVFLAALTGALAGRYPLAQDASVGPRDRAPTPSDSRPEQPLPEQAAAKDRREPDER